MPHRYYRVLRAVRVDEPAPHRDPLATKAGAVPRNPSDRRDWVYKSNPE